MIHLQNVCLTYNASHVNEVKALQNILLQIDKGEFVVIVGANGSGKSTLLHAIAGTIPINTGKIFFNEINVTAKKEYERSKWIARVFQNPLQGTAPNLSILENCRLAFLRTSAKKIRIGIDKEFENKIKEFLSVLNMGLENKLHQLAGNLSGGQRQALTLMMSVLDDCSFILLDEPTAALDPKTAEKIMEITNSIIEKYKLTALLISHNLKDASRYGNRIIQMEEGKIIKDIRGEAKNNLTSENIFSWF